MGKVFFFDTEIDQLTQRICDNRCSNSQQFATHSAVACSFVHWDRKKEINSFALGYLWNIKCSRDLGYGRRRRGLAPVDGSLLRPIWEVRFFCWSTKKQFKVSAISPLLVMISLSSANCCNSCSRPSLPDRHLIRFQSFRELCLFSENLVLKYVCFVCLFKLVT